MRPVWIILVALLLILGLLITPPVQCGMAALVAPWTARGVAQQVVYCPDNMAVVPGLAEVTDNRLGHEGIIRFRAVCFSRGN